jgi:hypothetical protein
MFFFMPRISEFVLLTSRIHISVKLKAGKLGRNNQAWISKIGAVQFRRARDIDLAGNFTYATIFNL